MSKPITPARLAEVRVCRYRDRGLVASLIAEIDRLAALNNQRGYNIEELAIEVMALKAEVERLRERELSLEVILKDHMEPEVARLNREVERLRSDPETREWAAMRQDRDEFQSEVRRLTERNEQLRRQREVMHRELIKLRAQ